jgi:hypothetical protein
MRRHGLGMFAEPPFARLLFAVLFGLPVLRHNVLGGQGEDLGASWAHDDGGERGVIILDLEGYCPTRSDRGR